MRTTRSGSEKGRPRRKRSWIKLKIAVFAPIPSARVRTVTKVNPGDLRSWRRAKRRSFMSFGAQCDNWIDARSAARRQPRSEEGRSKKEESNSEIDSRIDPLHFEEHALQRARERKSAEQTNDRANQKQMHSVRKNEHADLGRARAQRKANTDFTDAFERGIGEQSIKTDSRQHQRESSKNGKEKGQETLRAPGLADAIAHRPGIEYRQRGIN